MEAGKLRHRVLVQSQTAATSVYGKGAKAGTWGPVTGDETSSTFYAFVRPLRSQEVIRAQQPGAETAYQVSMRYNALVQSNTRLVWGEKILYVVGTPTDVNGRHVELDILCNEREPTGGA